MGIDSSSQSNEVIREYFLNSLNIIDSPIEGCFERITRLMHRIFDVDGCGLSFIDKDRIWFKSIKGFMFSEMLRLDSFCHHVIESNGLMIIPDATVDPRFNQIPIVISEPHIRFYAGVPVAVGEGVHIGVLCLFNKKTKILSEEDIEVLKDFSTSISLELNKRIQKKFGQEVI